MSLLRVWIAGLRRVRRAPAVLLVLWLGTLAATVPPALVLQDAIRAHLGESLEADSAADGVNYDWMQEFTASGDPLTRTLRPDVIGFAAVMDNSSALADAGRRAPVVVVSGVAYLVFAWFLMPGAIHRLAVDQRMGARRFLARCGACAARLLRLGLFSALVYAVLFGSLHAWLFDDLYDRLTHDLTVERTAFLLRLAGYLLFFAIVAVVNLWFDVAKVRMIVEDRRSIVSSLDAAARFIAARPALMFGTYAMNVLLFAAVLGAYYLAAPGASGGSHAIWAAFAVGQAYIAARLFTKLAFWGTEVCALQARFGCAGFARGEPLT
ncbi:MAG: hypothetical protein AB7H96_07580 [Vicinamibacterales bacterium]